MRKQHQLEAVRDTDLDRVIGGTRVAQIGSDWMVSGMLGSASPSARGHSLAAQRHDGFVGMLAFLPSHELGGPDDVNVPPPQDQPPAPEQGGDMGCDGMQDPYGEMDPDAGMQDPYGEMDPMGGMDPMDGMGGCGGDPAGGEQGAYY